MADETLKQSLINELALARSQFGVSKAELRDDFAVGKKLKRQVHRNPAPWFAGAAIVGLLLSKLPPMRRKVVVKPPKVRRPSQKEMGKAGIAVALLNFALQLAKPTLLKIIQEQFAAPFRAKSRRAANQASSQQPARA
jgi:hypothetical protein